MQRKAFSFWGGFAPPDSLTRGSAPKPRWSLGAQPPDSKHISPMPAISPLKMGCLDKPCSPSTLRLHGSGLESAISVLISAISLLLLDR